MTQASPPSTRPPRIYMLDLLATVPYYTAYLSRALLHLGADLTIGSITYYLDPDCFSSRDLRIDPGALNLVGRFPLPRLLRRVLKLIEAAINLAALAIRFSRSPPDVIHVQYLPLITWKLPLDLWLLKYARRLGSKIVLTVHDLLPHDSDDKHQAVFNDLYHFVDHLICHSASIQQRLVSEFHLDPARISIIPHGPFFYDLPVQEAGPILTKFGVPAASCLVLWQGLVFPYKGVDLLLDAWQSVEQADDKAFLVVAGTGDAGLLLALRQQAAALNLKRVHLYQHFITTPELVALYRAAQVIVYPYRAITTSGALATGLAFGKTILATDLPVFREQLHDGENACLVPAEKKLLSEALIRLLSDEPLRKSFSAKIEALGFAESSWQDIARQTLSAYN